MDGPDGGDRALHELVFIIRSMFQAGSFVSSKKSLTLGGKVSSQSARMCCVVLVCFGFLFKIRYQKYTDNVKIFTIHRYSFISDLT